MSLTEAFQSRFEWLAALSKEDIKQLMEGLKERIDFVTITGSLNAELTDPRY